MTWLRDVLVDLADESPQVDLAERTIATRDHKRRTAISLLAAAMVVVTALGATLAVRLVPQATSPATSGKGDMPARGAGPLSHAYKTFCKPVSGKALSHCQDGGWRVVTRSGRTYHVSEALPSLSPGRTGLQDSPLAISRDSRKIAYYSAKEGTFQVRDLASGAKTTAPMKLPPKTWLYSMTRLMLSDDGRYLAFSKVPELKHPALLFDMRDSVRPRTSGPLCPHRPVTGWSHHHPRGVLTQLPAANDLRPVAAHLAGQLHGGHPAAALQIQSAGP
ncbi:hypothetical protein [Nonomuraea aurantiaca]|uniref:hypothetical protein n=1 Tax=Nonomuraea aurantiaca TaxID=2878562 RepID=UPI001CD9EA73|nr:hypothetical protein [Nonomuraea aurantiaca]MCA2230232.1 hypothetical protein [Nonomuraea aurantiaca]